MSGNRDENLIASVVNPVGTSFSKMGQLIIIFGIERRPRFFEQKFRVDKWNCCRGLCCHAEWQIREVGLIGGVAVKTLMWTFGIVEVEITSN